MPCVGRAWLLRTKQRPCSRCRQNDSLLHPAQRSAGTGLGLAISARIIREFGGTLSVGGKKGVGSTFTLTFKPTSS